jgi:hypothetical protein
MKKLIYLILAAAFVSGCVKKEKETESAGNIYGVITDKATGEPVRAAGVQLNPTGTNTVTGDEGQYEFADLKAGEYTLYVTKTGYSDLVNYRISVAGGKTNKGDVQLEKLPPSLRVVNDSKQDISELDFGSALSDVSRSFNIFNDGPESLEWQLTETAEWITGVSKSDGTLKAGATQAIIVTIDRDRLAGGANTTTIHVTSNNGSKQLTVQATNSMKLPTLNVLDVTNIRASSATFTGRITDGGNPAYTERGFVYSMSSTPTIENSIAKLSSAVTESAEFSENAGGLTLNQTYYVRAYAINSAGAVYSTNEANFITVQVLPTVATQAILNLAATTATFNGNIAGVGDPAYTEKGFVYGVAHNPAVEDINVTVRTVSGSGAGIFSANITELTTGQLYYLRAYATNGAGTAYGEEVSFTPNSPYAVILPAAGLMVQKTDINGNSLVSWSTAYSLCDNSTLDGYTDWRLPTKDELAVLYNERNTIGGFVTSSSPYYWSSTAASSSAHWFQNFSSGAQNNFYADDSINRCRCVRNN